MKEQSENKAPLVNMSQEDPLYPSIKKNYQVDSNNNNLGESKMFKEKIINNHLEIKIEYLYTIPNTYNLLYLAELDNVVP